MKETITIYNESQNTELREKFNAQSPFSNGEIKIKTHRTKG